MPTHYQDYANYLRRFSEVMGQRGAPIYAVSIQNEPNYEASYDGCLWSPAEMRDFHIQVQNFTQGITGWGGGKATPRVLIMTGESANNPNINTLALEDSRSRPYIDLIGRHVYGEAQNRYSPALDHQTDPKEVWMTEYNINSGNVVAYPNDHTWNYVWPFMNDVDLSMRLNDESAYIWWAMKRFYSFIGDGMYGATEGAILPRGYALSHYAKFAKETWRCAVSASGKLANGTDISSANFNNTTFSRTSLHVKVTAYVTDDDNTISMVLFTPTNTSGGNGHDMGTVRIQLPVGFTAKTVTAMRSNAAVKARPEEVLMSADRNAAFIMLPPSNIVSISFTR
jgi:O-glycosyl hydrolase